MAIAKLDSWTDKRQRKYGYQSVIDRVVYMCEDFASLQERKQVSLVYRPMALKVHQAYATALDEKAFLVSSIIPVRISRRICCTK